MARRILHVLICEVFDVFEDDSSISKCNGSSSFDLDDISSIIMVKISQHAKTSSSAVMQYLLECYIRAEKSTRTSPTSASSSVDSIKETLTLYVLNALSCGSFDGIPVSFSPVDFATDFVTLMSSGRVPSALLRSLTLVGAMDAIPLVLDECSRRCLSKPFPSGIVHLDLICRIITLSVEEDQISVLFSHESFGDVNELKSDCKVLEEETWFGRVFSLSTMKFVEQLTKEFGVNFSKKLKLDVERDTNQYRATTVHVSDNLHSFVRSFLCPSTRNEMLRWLGVVINCNSEWTKAQVEESRVNSRGFLLNLASVMLKLASPFIDASGNDIAKQKRFQKVDWKYPFLSSRLQWPDELINSDSEKLRRFVSSIRSENENTEFSFVTECFFMTYRMLGIALRSQMHEYGQLLRRLRALVDQLERAKKQTPVHVPRLEKMIEDSLGGKAALECHMGEPSFLSSALEFYVVCCRYLCSVADPGGNVHPLPEVVPDNFACFPEMFIADILYFLSFLRQFFPETLYSVSLEPVVVFLTTFGGDKRYVNNPHLRGKMAEALGILVPSSESSAGYLNYLLLRNEVAKKFLTGALWRLYVDCERTGSSMQFYEKFGYRMHISQILEYLWSIPTYRKGFVDESRKPEFVQFVHMLISDMEYTLSTSMDTLKEIHDAENSRLEDRSREEQLQQKRDSVGGLLNLANKNVHMMAYVSHETVDPFLAAEMIERIAALLDFFLMRLVGDELAKLKVSNPEELNFHPRNLLSEIIDCYLNFSPYHEFHLAVAKDGRSYRPECFQRGAVILRNRRIKTENEIQRFVALERAVKIAAQEEEELLGKVDSAPDEFIDPIMQTLMKDPVRLPSGHIVDRSTINHHILSDPTDPFNRQSLSVDQLVPEDALRKRIEEYMKPEK